MAPMAFQFATVELGLVNDEGEPVTSAVLNQIEWAAAPEATAKKPLGKNQVIALDILKHLEAGTRKNQSNDGRISLDQWRNECKADGIPKQRFYDVRISLEKFGMITIQDSFVSSLSSVSDSRSGPVRSGTPPYYIRGALPDVTTVTDKTGKYETLPKTLPVTKPVENTLESNAPDLFTRGGNG
jgi:hypothetical protein